MVSAVSTSGDAPNIFSVKDCALIAIATGRQAYTLGELRDALANVTSDSLYYHFWGSLLQPRFEEREYNNDFAAWVKHYFHDGILAERLAVLDPNYFPSLDLLCREVIDLIEQRLDENESLAWLRASVPFELVRSQTVVFDTRERLAHPAQLARLLPSLSTSSIFFHFIDARRRTDGEDDFRNWLKGFGEEWDGLRMRLAEVDPYFAPLTELRSTLSVIFTIAMEERPDAG